MVHRIADKGQGEKSDDGRVLWDRYGYRIPIPIFFQLKALRQSLVLHAANVVGISAKQNTNLTNDSFCREK